jgi:predicted ABC-type ATPase
VRKSAALGSASPHIVVLAGPNGAGKSTAAPTLLRGTLQVDEFVNADVIARGISGFQPDRAAMEAGRIMLARLKSLAAKKVNLAFETTLASRSFAPWLNELLAQGYAFRLVFLWLPSPEMALARVEARVRAGGHAVPEETIRRRYTTGLRNFFQIYSPLATTWRFYDNGSPTGPRLVATGRGSVEKSVSDARLWQAIKVNYGHEPHS